MKAKQTALPGEAIILVAFLVVAAAGLFEWIVILPENPGGAALRVGGAALAAFVALLPFRRT